MRTITVPGNALFTLTQQRILGLLYGKPDQSFYTIEIARWAKVRKGSLVRELQRLQLAGMLIMSRQGNQTHYKANPDSPIYIEPLGIMRKTFGMWEPLRGIEVCLASSWTKLFHIGLKNVPIRSTPLDALSLRDGRIYRGLAMRPITHARALYAKESLDIDLETAVYALDATTVDLCLSLFDWVPFRQIKAAVKIIRRLICAPPGTTPSICSASVSRA